MLGCRKRPAETGKFRRQLPCPARRTHRTQYTGMLTVMTELGRTQSTISKRKRLMG